jgi:hypothetical protein
MAHARPSCPPDNRPALSALDRRLFLRVGVIGVAPLLVAGTLGQVTRAWAGATPQPTTDPVLDHVSRELTKICRGMRGVEGVKGEHVRALAANLDLVAAHLQQSGNDRRLDAGIRAGIDRSGRDAFALELHARHAEIAVDTAVRYGIVSQVRLDQTETSAALDRLQQEGVAPALRQAVPGLISLGAWIDRNRARKEAEVLRARQKPGDDFLGYNLYPPPNYRCSDLKLLVHEMSIAAAVFGICGSAWGGGIFALVAEGLSILYDSGCDPQEAI